MRAFLILTLFATLLLASAVTLSTAAGPCARPAGSSRCRPRPPLLPCPTPTAPAPDSSFREILWAFEGREQPSEWTEKEIVGRGKYIEVDNPGGLTPKGKIQVTLDLPDVITYGEGFTSYFEVEATPNWSNVWRLNWLDGMPGIGFYFGFPKPPANSSMEMSASWTGAKQPPVAFGTSKPEQTPASPT